MRPSGPAVTGHPCPGAQPGETIAAGPGHRWIAYEPPGSGMVAACYADGGLIRRDLRGWWRAGPRGERVAIPGEVVAGLVGSAPDGWPVLAEQEPLLGAEPDTAPLRLVRSGPRSTPLSSVVTF